MLDTYTHGLKDKIGPKKWCVKDSHITFCLLHQINDDHTSFTALSRVPFAWKEDIRSTSENTSFSALSRPILLEKSEGFNLR